MERNTLYPIFLKSSNLHILIVGGGNVAEEKLSFLTKSSPDARVTILAPLIREGTKRIARAHNIELITDKYRSDYLQGYHIVIATTDEPATNLEIYRDCRSMDKLINVADNPPLCDFYMGGIVTKGHVKLAISTNGKSPTTAKRLRQFFEEVLPDDISTMVDFLNRYRKQLKGGFEYKVEKLNRLTEILVNKDPT